MIHSWDSYSWWGPAPLMGLGFLGVLGLIVGAALLIVIIALKGYALWYSARRGEKWWFVVMLVINTAGLLELFYLIFIVKKWHKGMKGGTMGANEGGSGQKTA